MPEATGAAGASAAALKVLTDALDISGKAAKSTPPSSAPSTPGAPVTTPPAVETGLSANATGAVDRYRQTMRWMLGAFGAVALVVFGSIPFTDLNKATQSQQWWIRAGLTLVGIGLVLVIYAATRVLEPEDASLSELSSDWKKVDKQRKRWDHVKAWSLRSSWVFPRTQARAQMITALTDEAGDLGPPWPGRTQPQGEKPTSRLIGDIFEAQKLRYGIAGDVAFHKARVESRMTALSSARETVATRWTWVVAATPKSSTEAVPLVPPGMAWWWASAELVRAAAAEKDAIAAYDQSVSDLRTEAEELARVDARLEVHLQHREMVIDESGVAQLRGTFRLARRLVVLGALATGMGAAAYASQLPPGPSSAEKASASPGSPDAHVVEFSASSRKSGTGVAVSINRVRGPLPPAVADCRAVTMTGLTSGEFKPKGEAPVKVVITDPMACRGTWTIPASSARIVVR
jgi:hypothetical protein